MALNENEHRACTFGLAGKSHKGWTVEKQKGRWMRSEILNAKRQVGSWHCLQLDLDSRSLVLLLSNLIQFPAGFFLAQRGDQF